jgi:cell division protein FtsN
LSGKTTLAFLYKINKNFLKRNQLDAESNDEVLDVQNDLEDLKVNERLKENHSKSKTIAFFKDLESGFTKVEKDTSNEAGVTENHKDNPETKELLEKSQANQKESNQKPNKQEEQDINPF